MLLIRVGGVTTATAMDAGQVVPNNKDAHLPAWLQVFFSFIGFDTVASAAEEARNPSQDVPVGIIGSLGVCALLYALMCATIVGMTPWQEIDLNTPFSAAYAAVGWPWAGKIVAVGALMGIVTSLLVNLYGQIRLLMTLGREGLLPPQCVCCFPFHPFKLVSLACCEATCMRGAA